MMRNIKLVFFVLLICTVAVSCEGEEKERMIEQDTAIEKFITSLEDRYKDTITVNYSNGISRVVFDKGNPAISISAGDSVSFYFTASTLNGSYTIVFETNIKSLAIELGMDTLSRSFEPKRGLAGKGQFLDGLDRGLLMCNNREHSFLIFNSDLGFGSSGTGMVPEYAPLVYEVFIEGVRKN